MSKDSESENEQSGENKITFADFDKLNLKPFAESLFRIMEKGIASSVGEQGAYTISLNAEFGNGKTTFLNLFVEDFIRVEKREDYNVLFINAWESDFYGEPIIVILSELANYIKKNNGEENKNINQDTRDKILKVIGSIGNQVIQNKTGFNLKQTFNNDLKKNAVVGEEILKDFTQRKRAIKEIKEIVSEYVAKEKRLLIVVDELDRTRPDYAVRLLEDMKHFFDLEGVVFLVAVNRKQMEATVQCLYGQKLNFNGYYRKFFKQEIDLPNPYKAARKFVSSLMQKTKIQYKQETSERSVYVLCKLFEFTLREIESFMRVLEGVLDSNNRNRDNGDKQFYIDCISFFVCLYFKEKVLFKKTLSGDFKINDLFNFLRNRNIDISTGGKQNENIKLIILFVVVNI